MFKIYNTIRLVTILACFVDVQVFAMSTVAGFEGDTITVPCTLKQSGTLEWRGGSTSIVSRNSVGIEVVHNGPYKGDVSLVKGNNLLITLRYPRDADYICTNLVFTCFNTIGGGLEKVEVILLVRITEVSIEEAINGQITVTSGTPKTLTCSVAGDPNPCIFYSWSVNGKEYASGSKLVFTPDDSTRTIKCTVQNRFSNGSVLSEKEASVSVAGVSTIDPVKATRKSVISFVFTTPRLAIREQVKLGEKPTTSTVAGFEGDTITLPCTLKQSGTLEWRGGQTSIVSRNSDGIEVVHPGPYKGDVSLVKGNNLLITLRYPRDADYFCTNLVFTCSNTIGLGLEKVVVILLVRITEVSIEEAINGQITITSGTPKTLTCSVAGDPNPCIFYSWSVNGKEYASGSKLVFTPDDSTRTIKCTVQNRFSNGSVLSEKEASVSVAGVSIVDPVKATRKSVISFLFPTPRLAIREQAKLGEKPITTHIPFPVTATTEKTDNFTSLIPGPEGSSGNGADIGGGIAAVVVVIVLCVGGVFLF